MVDLQFHVLGPLRVVRDRVDVPVSAPAKRRLLALLLVRPDEALAQAELIDALWLGSPPRTARAAFQNLVHALRDLLGAEWLPREPAGYRLRVPDGALDAQRFRRLAGGTAHLPALERASRLRQALELWRGPAFADLAGDPWARTETALLEGERLVALEDRIEADLELGGHAVLVPELEGLVNQHPLRERLWFQLMLSLYRAGRQAEALDAYRRAHEWFTAELGLEPGVTLRELQRAILVHDRTLDDRSRAVGSTLERAAALLPRRPPERAESLLEYGAALIRIGELHQARTTVAAAARLASTAGDLSLATRASIVLAYLRVFADGQSLLELLTAAERGSAVFAELADDAGLAFALRYQAHVLRELGRAGDALALGLRAAELAETAGDREIESTCLHVAAQAAALGPTPVAEALALCDRADAARGDGRPSVGDARAWLLAQGGDVDRARSVYERELEMLRADGTLLNVNVALARCALAERAAGDLERAADHLRTAYAMVGASDIRGDRAGLASELAAILALRGELEDARRLAEESRAAAVSPDVMADTLWRRALALVSAQEGRSAEAVRWSDEAVELAGETDWLTFHAETLEDAATVDTERAAAALATALDLYEQKGSVAPARRVRERLSLL